MRALTFVVAGVLGVLGCGGRPQTTETLTESIRGYNDGVRWGRYPAAAMRVPPEARTAFVIDMDERAEDVKITDYEIIGVDTRSPTEAAVRVKVSWYRASEGTLHDTHAEQTWERRGKAWLMVGEERVRGEEMPGLHEAADKAATAAAAGAAAEPGEPAEPAPAAPANPAPAQR